MKIYIDPGHNHSGADTGAVGFGLKEQDISVQIGVILRNMLVGSGHTVKMSREKITDNTPHTGLSASLADRYNGANNWGADIFISIHCNAANTRAYGCETYCCTGSTNGYRLALAVQPHLVAETGRYNRGVKTAGFAVIKHTSMPAILVETAFIDNYDDNKFLASESGRHSCAVAIYKGVQDYIGRDYNNISESEDIDMTKYEELKLRIDGIEKENNRQNDIINLAGQEIHYLMQQDEIAKRRYNSVAECPDWAQEAIQYFVDRGDICGDENGKLDLTYDMVREKVFDYRKIQREAAERAKAAEAMVE